MCNGMAVTAIAIAVAIVWLLLWFKYMLWIDCIATTPLGATGEQNEHGESKTDRQAEVKLSSV